LARNASSRSVIRRPALAGGNIRPHADGEFDFDILTTPCRDAQL